MTESSPFTTLTAGYAASKPPRKAPLPFRTDDRLEQLIKDVVEGKVTPTPEVRMAMGFYTSAKDAARAAGKEST
jgi:hypothetical protein